LSRPAAKHAVIDYLCRVISGATPFNDGEFAEAVKNSAPPEPEPPRLPPIRTPRSDEIARLHGLPLEVWNAIQALEEMMPELVGRDRVTALMMLGRTYARSHWKMSLARPCFEAALQLDPGNKEALLWLTGYDPDDGGGSGSPAPAYRDLAWGPRKRKVSEPSKTSGRGRPTKKRTES
jgi:hypothetical protein